MKLWVFTDIQNFIFIFIVLTLFTKYSKQFLSPILAFLSSYILAFYICIIQSQFPGIVIVESQDIANAAFFLILLLLAKEKQWFWFGIVLVISIMNRETTLILLAPFGYLLLKKRNFKPLIFIVFCGIFTYLGIRILMDVNQGNYPDFENLKTNFPGLNRDFLYKSILHNVYLFSMIVPILILSFYNLKTKNSYEKALLLTAIPFFIIHYIMGTIVELRLFFPLILLILPICIKNLNTIFVEKQ